MKLSPHFTLDEFTFSQTAARHDINNNPTGPVMDNLRRLATFMESVRVTLGNNPIHISSGYRSPPLNARVGGAYNSAHMVGRAVDFVCPGYGTPLEVCQRLSDAGVPFDKLILEAGRWVHLQIAEWDAKPRRQVLNAKFDRRLARYNEGLL